MAALKELQRDLENKANDLNKLQKEISKNHQVRKKYTIQLGENELVLKELDLLNEDANVYKLIGPVLVKQDLAEANANVRKRIEYISAELKRSDAALQDLDEKQNSKKEAEVFSRYNKEFRCCKLEKARHDPETAASIVGHLISSLTNFTSYVGM
ncbi:Prefoldin subunit 6 [Orobanche minor]